MESVRAAAKPRWPFPALAFQPAGFPALAAMAGAVRSVRSFNADYLRRSTRYPFSFRRPPRNDAIWSACAFLNAGRSVTRVT